MHWFLYDRDLQYERVNKRDGFNSAVKKGSGVIQFF